MYSLLPTVVSFKVLHMAHLKDVVVKGTAALTLYSINSHFYESTTDSF